MPVEPLPKPPSNAWWDRVFLREVRGRRALSPRSLMTRVSASEIHFQVLPASVTVRVRFRPRLLPRGMDSFTVSLLYQNRVHSTVLPVYVETKAILERMATEIEALVDRHVPAAEQAFLADWSAGAN